MNIIRRPFRYRNDGAVYWLIGVNALVFAASWLLGPGFGRFLTQRLAMVPALVLRGWVWTFVSYMFIHSGLSHFVFNMLALFVFGTRVERQMGSREFLLYYLLTGALAGLFSFAAYLLTGAYYVYLMGASGAIFAVELAYAVFFPDSVIYLWGIIPLPAPVMVLGFTGLELFFAITGSATGVAHITHLVGFVFGWLYFLVRLGMNPWRRLTGR